MYCFVKSVKLLVLTTAMISPSLSMDGPSQPYVAFHAALANYQKSLPSLHTLTMEVHDVPAAIRDLMLSLRAPDKSIKNRKRQMNPILSSRIYAA